MAPEAHALTQRFSLEKLQAWEALGFGMFVHFGMSTFIGEECPDGGAPLEAYAPTGLDVDQWTSLAVDAGMKYVVLTAKHVAGHCLWPTTLTPYSVAATGQADVVGALAEACAKRGLKLGIYYCSWDNHNRFGTVTVDEVGIYESRVTTRYLDFQLVQLGELIDRYSPIFQLWIDIPQVLGPQGRQQCYDFIARKSPDTFVVMNQGCQGSSLLDTKYAWPTDIATRERQFPECARWGQGESGTTDGHSRIYEIEGSRFYVPTEICDCLGYYWFHDERDRPRSVAEVRALRTLARARSCNLLLNVPPGRDGRISDDFARVLLESAN